MDFLFVLLQMSHATCNSIAKKIEATEFYLFDISAPGPLSYTNLCRDLNIKPVQSCEILNLSDTKNRQGLFINKIDSNDKETRAICVDIEKSNQGFCSFFPDYRQMVNSKNYSITFKPVLSFTKEDGEVKALRTDYPASNLPEVLYATKLKDYLFPKTDRLLILINKIISDFKDKVGIYKLLSSGEYNLLYFKNEIEWIENFFKDFKLLLQKNDKNCIFQNLYKEYKAQFYKTRGLKLMRQNSVTSSDTTYFSLMYIDIANILALAENPKVIFEIPNIDNKEIELKGEPVVLITLKNNFGCIERDLTIKNDLDIEIPCHYKSVCDKYIKMILKISDLKTQNSKSLSVFHQKLEIELEKIYNSFK